MSEVSVRSFRPGDLAPLVALWNRSLPKDPITEERFWQLFLLDQNFDQEGALVAEASGQIIGFLQAIVRRYPLGSLGTQPTQGWITVFLVDPVWHRQGVGSRLLHAGLAYLRQQGRTSVMCNGYAPYYIFPGVDEEYTAAVSFMEANGFTQVSDPVAMSMRLEGVRMPDATRQRWAELTQEGYEVRMFQREDTLPLLTFAEAHFPHWAPSVLEGLQRGNLEIVLATKGGRIVGFTQWENPHNDPPNGAQGRFGPFGVDPALRSQGIGAIIFYYLIERVAGNGARYLWFGWAGGRNLSFYERAGCTITRRFKLYRKEL